MRIINSGARLLSVLFSPAELMSLNFMRYKKQKYWENRTTVNSGLRDYEEEVTRKYLRRGDKALILFCGGGREIIYFLKKGYKKVIGIDFSPPSIDSIQQYFNEDISSKIKIVNSSLPTLTIDEDDFDIAVAFNDDFCTIIGQENRIRLLRNIYSRLKKGGYFIFNILIVDKNTNNKGIFEKMFRKKNEHFYSGIFVHFYSDEKELEKEIKECNFSKESIYRIPSRPSSERMVILEK